MRIETQRYSPHTDVVRMYAQRVADERRGDDSMPARAQAETPEYQVGFGENTISTGAVALHAINRNLRDAREVVPSVEERLSQVRERLENLTSPPDLNEGANTQPVTRRLPSQMYSEDVSSTQDNDWQGASDASMLTRPNEASQVGTQLDVIA